MRDPKVALAPYLGFCDDPEEQVKTSSPALENFVSWLVRRLGEQARPKAVPSGDPRWIARPHPRFTRREEGYGRQG